ncbi:haloacid dehalogenase-like hydrolase [Streptomyces sp. bgisy091]|uniref:haloacid dehalogenase-like hydrolase n=1 Tax=Streptomyces sp. bgisy091 TaxID=3413778 RepID=UPI003D7415D7
MNRSVLPSWNDGEARSAILRFIEEVTSPGEGFLPPEERVAVFDNDGTLWPEKPVPVQLHFLLLRWKEMATADASLAGQEPYASAITGDPRWVGSVVAAHYGGDDTQIPVLAQAVVAAQKGLSTGELADRIQEFFRTEVHPELRRPYTACAYRPMTELLELLREKEFTTVIASGGGRDFMRLISAPMYGVRPDQVIGSMADTVWSDSRRTVVYGEGAPYLDDGPAKPVRIWSRLGRRPVLACGNSNGDIEMLDYATSDRPGLGLLIRHDDYGRGDTAYTTGAERILAEAPQRSWTTVSVRDDWSRIFSDAEQPLT